MDKNSLKSSKILSIFFGIVFGLQICSASCLMMDKGFRQAAGERLAIPVRAAEIKLQVPIPVPQGEPIRTVSIDGDTIGRYIKNMHAFGISILGILSVIMVMVGGFQWLTAAGQPNKISEARERITYAVIGLLLGLGSYMILRSINVALVEFPSLDIAAIETEEQAICGDASRVFCGKKYDEDDRGKITCTNEGACVGTACASYDEKCNLALEDPECEKGCIPDGEDAKGKAENCCSGMMVGLDAKCVSGQWGSECDNDSDCLEGGCTSGGFTIPKYCSSKEIGSFCSKDGDCSYGQCAAPHAWNQEEDALGIFGLCTAGEKYSFCTTDSDCVGDLGCKQYMPWDPKLCCGASESGEKCKRDYDNLLKSTGDLLIGSKCTENRQCQSGYCAAPIEAGTPIAVNWKDWKVCTRGKLGDPCDDDLDCDYSRGYYGRMRCSLGYCREGEGGDICEDMLDCISGKCEGTSKVKKCASSAEGLCCQPGTSNSRGCDAP